MYCNSKKNEKISNQKLNNSGLQGQYLGCYIDLFIFLCTRVSKKMSCIHLEVDIHVSFNRFFL